MSMGCAGFAAASATSTTKKEEVPYSKSIFLANDPNIKDLIKEFEKSNEMFKIKIRKESEKNNFETKIGDNTLFELIQNYKNKLDDAAAYDKKVKRCLDAYNEAFVKKDQIILDIINKIRNFDENLYLDPFKDIINNTSMQYRSSIIASLLDLVSAPLDENDFQSAIIRRLIEKSQNNDIRLTAAKKALHDALGTRFAIVIDLDKELDEYYYNWSKTTYHSKLGDPSSIWRGDDDTIKNIILNIAQFTRLYHLESYDSMINNKRKLNEYLAQLEAVSKEMHEAVADFRKQFKFPKSVKTPPSQT